MAGTHKVFKPHRLTQEEIESLRRDNKEAGDQGLAEFERVCAERAERLARRIGRRKPAGQRKKA